MGLTLKLYQDTNEKADCGYSFYLDFLKMLMKRKGFVLNDIQGYRKNFSNPNRKPIILVNRNIPFYRLLEEGDTGDKRGYLTPVDCDEIREDLATIWKNLDCSFVDNSIDNDKTLSKDMKEYLKEFIDLLNVCIEDEGYIFYE